MKKFVKLGLAVLTTAALCPLTSLATPRITAASIPQTTGTTYYLDSNIGKKDGDGLSPTNAFDSLDDVNNKTFKPGDRLLIKANSKFTGTLWPKGSGAPGKPIVIDMYGTGNKPQIDANGSYFVPQTKDWQGPFTGQNHDQIGAGVYLYNQSYVEINNLDVKNTGDNVDRDRSGIRIEGYDAGVINHIYIRNCNIHDVRGFNGQDDIYSVIPTNPDGSPVDGYTDEDQSSPNTTNTFWGARTTHRTGGINLVTYTARLPEAPNKFNVPVQELDTSKKITRFNDVLIEGNTIENCQANGITTTNVKGTLDDTTFRHTNVIIRDNYIHNVTRAGIVPLYTSGALVEHNKVDTFQSTTAGYGCGIWCDRADGMIFQYNEVCNGQNGNDGMAFNLDDMTRDGIIQYNYTHDNYGGGYMLHIRQNSYNRNNTIRYNLSINDSGAFLDHNAQIVAVGETASTKLQNAKVYNNTFISNKDCHAVYSGDQVAYTNNIWYFTNPKMLSRQNAFAPGANSTFDNNAYYGCVAPSSDQHKLTADPQFCSGTNLFGLDQTHAYANANLKTSSPYIGKAVILSDNGQQDILAAPLVSHNLGAFDGQGHTPAITTQTTTATNVTKYLADKTQQTEVINETAQEANTKWVNTTFNSDPVIYTKKQGNYLEIPFTGTGGVLKLKQGSGAGNVTVEVLNASKQVIATKTVNTYKQQAAILALNDFANLSQTNQDYLLRITNASQDKVANFVSFTTNVAQSSPGCANDDVAGVVLEKLPQQTMAGQSSLRIPLRAHVFYDTCDPASLQTNVTYTVDNGGQIADDALVVTQPGIYHVTASVSRKDGQQRTSTITVNVDGFGQASTSVDKSKLKTLVSQLQTLDLNQYQDNGALANFKNLLAQANTLLSNDNVTQKQIDQMLKDLTTARAALTLKETKKPTTDKNNSNNAKPKQKLPQTGDSKQTVLGLLGFSILAIGAISLKKFN